jgi:translation initiation factor IF-2
VKADVNGSLEALTAAVQQIEARDVSLGLIHAGTGPVTENDVMLAKASSAIIIGFGVTVNLEAQKLADSEGVEIKLYNIIYKVLDDLHRAVQGLLKPEYEEVEVGRAEVRQLFSFSKIGTIAGSYVLSGKLQRQSLIRVWRKKDMLFEGKLDSLKRFQEDVKEVATGFECGLVVDGFDKLEPGDQIQAYMMQEKKR